MDSIAARSANPFRRDNTSTATKIATASAATPDQGPFDRSQPAAQRAASHAAATTAAMDQNRYSYCIADILRSLESPAL